MNETVITMLEVSAEFESAVRAYEIAVEKSYLYPGIDKETLQDIYETKHFVGQLARQHLGRYVTKLELVLSELKADLMIVRVGPKQGVLTTTKSEPYNKKKQNPYLAWVKTQSKKPDPRVTAAVRAGGEWCREVGKLWKDLYPTPESKEAYFIKHRDEIWPEVDFGIESTTKQGRSAYTCFQIAMGGQGMSSIQISNKWNSLPAEKKAIFDNIARDQHLIE